VDPALHALAYSERGKRILSQLDEQTGRNTAFIHLWILLAAALCVGLYLVATTVLIAGDGVLYIQYAQQLGINPIETMKANYQHPGYPWLIYMAHQLFSLLFGTDVSIQSWIYCGQGTALLFRLSALVVLYYISRHLFGAALSLWAMVILIVLPKPAEYGSDVLSDWPHLFFLSAALLLLLKGTGRKKLLFGLAGLCAGAGYLIRPECVQMLILGGLWQSWKLVREPDAAGRRKKLSCLLMLLAGFFVLAAPYMYLKGAVFPKKNVGQFMTVSEQQMIPAGVTGESPALAWRVLEAVSRLAENIGETLMWVFVPAAAIGTYRWFRSRGSLDTDVFFVIMMIVLNIPVVVWLYCKYGYMSDRHTLPLFLLPILFVPLGMQELGGWLEKRFAGIAIGNSRGSIGFTVLLVAGILICTPRLLEPIRREKQGYRAAADWLKSNTDSDSVVAVPDRRISFYAERPERVYDNAAVPADAEYAVIRVDTPQNRISRPALPGQKVYEYSEHQTGEVRVVIYKKF
jgi:hypothetical protein